MPSRLTTHCTAKRSVWDEAGSVVSIELVLTTTVVLIGLIIGLTARRDAMLSELSDAAGAIQDLNQCFQFQGITGHVAKTHGSDFVDSIDFRDSDITDAPDNCVVIGTAFNDEGTTTRRDTSGAIARSRELMRELLERRAAAGC